MNRFIYCLFILLITVSAANGQSLLSWEWQNPKPQGNTIRTAEFINPLIGFAITENSILLKTIDGGLNWTSHSPSLGTADFYDMHFVDALIGYIVCKDGKILKTINGGQTFTFQNSGITKSLYGVHFANTTTGYAVGDSGTVLKTSTGGSSWATLQRVDTIVNLKDVKFVNANTGYIIGRNSYYVDGAVPVFKTTNGGINWVRQSASYLLGLTLCIKDTNTIFAAGHFGEISKTTNAGANWAVVNYHAYASVNSIQFVNDSMGFAAGSDGYILKTVDSGGTWVPYAHLTAGFKYQYNAVAFTDHMKGFLMGERGHILKTINSGVTYDTLSTGKRHHLVSVQFFNSLTGYAAGEQKTLLKTTDGGISWSVRSTLNSGANPKFYSMHFLNENTGYLGYDLGQIAKTTNGGLNYTHTQLPSTQQIHAIRFIGSDTGYAGGKNNFFYRTFNAGANWSRVYPDSGYFFGTFTDIEFINSKTGFASNINGRMYKTTNSGTNWTADSLTTTDTLTSGIHSLHIINDSVIYGAGKSGRIFKTTDSGDNWTVVTAGDYHFTSMYFTDANIGYAAGRKGSSFVGGAAIVKTTNGGINWEEQVTYTSSNINSIVFATNTIGFATGDNGTILRTLTAGDHPIITSVTENGTETPEGFSLAQNYPNPFNPETNISFAISDKTLVSLKVYDLTGREVGVLINEIKPTGNYSIKFNGSNLSSGVYFYRLQAGKYSDTKKMVLIK